MTLIGARRWRVELNRCRCGRHYIVSVEPVVYVGRAEFRKCADAFRSYFMNLESKWRWIRSFADQAEAESFARDLAEYLGEQAFMVNGRLCLAMPREGT